MKVNPMAGKPAAASMLVDVPKLITAYYSERPDPGVASQRVAFGTSGHRGSSFERSFNQWHILAIAQAICEHRKAKDIDGPLFLGIDTHALAEPASASALEVLAANGVEVMIAEGTDYTPTPAVSHALLTYNRGRRRTTLPRTAASSTPRRTAGRPRRRSPALSRSGRTSFSRTG
jgi:phosphoglucomutase